jgi:hypothetical protein
VGAAIVWTRAVGPWSNHRGRPLGAKCGSVALMAPRNGTRIGTAGLNLCRAWSENDEFPGLGQCRTTLGEAHRRPATPDDREQQA